MKKFYLVLTLSLFVLLLGRTNLSAQQGVMFNQYLFNGLVLNPAYAGYKENWNANMIGRMQWIGIKGSPFTGALLADGTVLNEKIGVGLHFLGDQIGPQRTLSFFTNYSYRIKVDTYSRLAFGLSLGFSQFYMDRYLVDVANDPNDPILQRIVGKSNIRPDFNLGVFYDSRYWFAGLSGTELYGLLQKPLNDTSIMVKHPQVYLTAGGLIPITRHIMLRPSLLYKDDLKNNPTVDINLFVMLHDMIWVGATWRQGIPIRGGKSTFGYTNLSSLNAAALMVEVFVTKELRLGYSFDYPFTSGIVGLSNNFGSHEISIGYTLQTKTKSSTSPRYF